ncbi:MFS transporter [Azospirillum rugosum]|uniref:MFS family permease n=1 Tax=Azospirillum rugosum TaxID=416170 RepID=A0ABS4ST97_9PROT|nr:MFS transporter [Azospirillum rugosum]MBP2295791.1 MFS family permease [Azospirillum rugosum]MDQ0529098.1 MFS family permease [Azospirillum rugosum]
MSGLSQFRLLTLHYGFYQLAAALAGGFVGAYLLKLGFSLPTALLAYAALLTCRFGLRLVALSAARRLGFRTTIMLGAGLAAAQFLPLMKAGEPLWFAVWLLIVSLAESLYWPVYHAAAAVTGGEGSRGRELGIRTAVGALVGVLGPLAGGFLLERFGPTVDFGIAAALALASVLPLTALRAIPAGPVPSLRESVRAIDRAGILTFAADGWMASGLAMAWPMVLFGSLGSHYESFGIANAAAGVAGAAAGLVCGHAIDRGERDRCLALVCLALALGFALRACASWSPLAATIANATGAAIAGFYTPVVMSTVYDQAKRSGAAYRFHFAAEAGWDAGAVAGCLAAAAVAAVTVAPSLSLLPAALGVAAVYWCVRGQAAPAPRSLPVADAVTAG